MRLRDFASIADFFTDREIDDLQAAADARREARRDVRGPSVREWEGDLPPGYSLSGDADLMVLLGPCGSKVAAFSELGADPLEVIAAAWKDYE